MALSREVTYLKDFRGGLNLTTQLQSLNETESPDCLNVDFGLRGGFISRGGFRTQDYDGLMVGAQFLGGYYANDDNMLIMSDDGSLVEYNGTLTDTTFDITDNAAARVQMANHSSNAYFANCRSGGSIVMKRWNGTTVTNLTNTFNNDYTTPTGGNMPKARYVAQHLGYMWVADTVESGTRYPQRLRFSHVQQPEDWAEADYFEIEPFDDGDPITAIVPFREVLVVFKRSSMYVVYGYDRSDFQWERVETASGIDYSTACASNSGVLYWFSADGMLMGYNGRGVVPVSNAIRWWSEIGKIKQGGSHNLLWADNRLWLSLEAGSSETVDSWLFVYDPSIGDGAMTRYSPEVQDLAVWRQVGMEPDPLFIFRNDSNLYRFDRAWATDTVNDGSSISTVQVSAYYKTGWVDAGETATRKRWKRPRVTSGSDDDCTIRLRVFHDFSEVPYRQIEWPIEGAEDTVWGFTWDVDEWSSGFDGDVYSFDKVSSGGTAYAIQYEFSSADNLGRWWVDSIDIPFRRKAIR